MNAGFKEERPPHPRANASIFKILTFWWIIKLFKTGQTRDLEVNDLYTTLDDHSSSSLGKELERQWKIQITKAKRTNVQPSLFKALFHMFGPSLMLYGFLLFIIEIVFRMIQPKCIGHLISHFDPSTTDLKTATLAAITLTSSTLVCTVGLHQHLFNQCVIGYKMRIAVTSIAYSKALRLSKTALGDTMGSQVINLLSNDVNRFDTASLFLHFVWVGPLKTIVVTYYLWQEVGVSSVFGVAIMVMFVPLIGWLDKKTFEFWQKTASRTGTRIRLMNQIISSMQVIKMYTWEKPFTYLVQYARKKEMHQIRGSAYIQSVLLSFAVLNTRIALCFSILSYVLMGNDITAKKVFVVASYYNLLQMTTTVFFPQGIGQMFELLKSVERLRTFLLLEEKDDQVVDSKSIIVNYSNEAEQSNLNGSRIILSGATAKWVNDQPNNCLENINLTVESGRLVAVIGRVGAGKSSLLQMILRELPLSKGNIFVGGVVSYASQKPWLFTGSVQQNILFGLKMDKERYQKVIQVCALNTDFEQFPHGDRTIIGERGVSLSGGQKSRINLARAVYKPADIYLLDDPLFAVNTNIGKHLFEKCIKGYLKKRICILITHQIQYLTKVDQIFLIENANLTECSYQEIQASSPDFFKLIGTSVEPIISSDSESKCAKPNNLEECKMIPDQNSTKNYLPCIDNTKFGLSLDAPLKVAETCSSRNISCALYWSYFAAGGTMCKICFLLAMCIFTQILASGGDYWIVFWVNWVQNYFHSKISVEYNNTTLITDDIPYKWFWISPQRCIEIFVVLTLSMILVTLIRSFAFVSVCLKASMILHNKMLNAITRTSLHFFYINSSEQILNRFSKDIGVIDNMLPCIMMDCIQIGLTLVGFIIVVGLVNVYLMISTVVVGIILYKVRCFYLVTTESVKRLERVTRSPVYAHLYASLQNLTTIRVFEAEQILSKEFNNHQDLHSSAWYLFLSSGRAVGLWLDLICAVYMSIVIFSLLVFNSNTFSGMVGLVISQIIGLTETFQWGMRQLTELENRIVSVDRVLDYTNSQQEPALEILPDEKPPKDWPQNGQITFKNFYLRYSPDSPYVLKNLNISIKSMEKVGIIGRTGSGKSSLIRALFRLAVNQGSIIIDNIDINKLGLHELRSKLSIIPQEPVLFPGTLRTNLDPFDEYPDHFLWNALEEVELKNAIEDLSDGLKSKMSEGGSNFSIGQRQLVCLARAIVQNNTILVLDEATANVDPQTDALIQNIIRNKFGICTVLTIARRLKTVMDSDRVLVMDAGTMVEFDHPYNLLKNKDGFLYNMVQETGQSTAHWLQSVATKNYNKAMQIAKTSPLQLTINDVNDDPNRTP
ncbi:ABC transporter type 1, transmembrane domain,ABC transporter-like,P-loop containing nucleoside triphosphate [Cinara cedri]|uniref:ABC transporter type 1, transmembrane domain,ABC transporter-like,P-loop containing nucleoside triphosphate n=1 Tax=Cinara cedri TaxID=506608 RepID=A0A5E4NTL8_9HEMI|nr:ABC transporter type 1, transmembrane domain,ABC transporter-like,P-loop containing nucleoside triphosphate [Cinara cedri]